MALARLTPDNGSVLELNKTIYELQILRFIASMMVLISHVQHEASEQRFLNLSGFAPITPFTGGQASMCSS